MGPGQEHVTERDTSFSIPKLSPDGLNWVTFKTRFLYAMGSWDVEGHFDRSDLAPPKPTLSMINESKWMVADIEWNEAYLRSEKKWWHDEKVVCAQLAQVMSDSLLICIQHATSVADMWRTIISKFDRKGCMVQVNLHLKMMEKCASDSDDIQAHLDEVVLMHECLSRMGVAMHDDDYSSIILMSLPESYTTHLKTLGLRQQ